MNDKFTNITVALEQAINVLERLINLEAPSFDKEWERHPAVVAIRDAHYFAELTHRILSETKESMDGKVSTVRVSTSVDPRSACQIPPEVMNKEIEYQHAKALAREVARHAITAIRQDPVFDMMVFETTVTFIAPKKEKSR